MESHKIHVPRHKAAILSTNPIKANLVGHESIMYVYIEQWVYINIPVVIRGRPVHDSRNNFLPRHIPSDAMMTWWKTKARLHSARSQVLPVQQCTRHGHGEMLCDLKQRLSMALVTLAINFQVHISIACDFSRDPESYRREDLWSMASMASVSRHRAVLDSNHPTVTSLQDLCRRKNRTHGVESMCIYI